VFDMMGIVGQRAKGYMIGVVANP
ncbi:uncharacterized protein METZ01_LOCUS316657, partial [marine metagenome]